MRLIQEAADQELVWRKPSAFKEHDELCAGDEVLATLDWGSTWGALATARTAEGEWTCKRIGLWQQRIGIRPVGSEREVGHHGDGGRAAHRTQHGRMRRS